MPGDFTVAGAPLSACSGGFARGKSRNTRMQEKISFDDFLKIELRAGTIVKSEPFLEARKPAYKLWIDLGELGVKQSSAQVTRVYSLDDLPGKQVVCVTNFPPKRIAGFQSEVLVCGFDRSPEEVVLISPTEKVPNGSRLY
jgi:tRNA-binding protein